MSVVVLGLVAAALLAASLVHRYQRYKAQQRAQIRRLASAIPLIDESMGELGPVPLSQPLRVMLRGDVVDRYRTIRNIHKAYPQIDKQLQQAQGKLSSEGPAVADSVPPIEDEGQRNRLCAALERLVEFLERGGPISHHRTEERLQFIRELKERRAEVMARYHIVSANRLADQGDTRHAAQHLHSLMTWLLQQGPNTDFVRALYAEAETQHHQLLSARMAPAEEEAGAA